jgi:hypothetical protein
MFQVDEKLVIGLSILIAFLYHSRPEWQHIGNQIDAAFIFTRVDFVNVNRRLHQRWTFNQFVIAVWSRYVCLAIRLNPTRKLGRAELTTTYDNIRINDRIEKEDAGLACCWRGATVAQSPGFPPTPNR